MNIAVIYVPAALRIVTDSVLVATFTAQCYAYCEARGYVVTGLVTGQWSDVLKVFGAQAAEVVVVARPDHLDPLRIPRIEVVDQGPVSALPPRNAGLVPRRKRRPNQI